MVVSQIKREDYEAELRRKQNQHLDNIANNHKDTWRPCLHDQCTACLGTGVKADGSACIHYISCLCPKCTPQFM